MTSRLALLPLVVLCWLAAAPGTTADLPPVITSATATPASVTTKATTLRAVATDETPATLTYTWSATGPAAVVYSAANGTVTGKTATATFSAPGSYAFTVAVADAGGQITTSPAIPVEVVRTLTTLTLTPTTTVVNQGTTVAFAVVSKDQFAVALDPQPPIAWTATGAGSIDASGLFTAGADPGSATVTATVGAKTISRTVRVNAAPTVAAGIATDTPVITGTTAVFTAQGADDQPINDLLYTWSAVGPLGGSVPKGVSFAPRSSILGETTTATFTAIGTYTVTVRISDKQGLGVTAHMDVTVLPTATTLTIAPATGIVVNPGLTKPFVATVRDQFKAIMAPQPQVAWSLDAGSGAIGSDGIYLAGDPGQTTVRATAGAATGTATLRVNAAPTVQTAVATDTPEITGTTAVFTVQGADDDNVDLLSYSWTATGPKGVAFVPRSGVTAESTTATFTAAGTYTITAKISDKQGLFATSSRTVSVVQTPTGLALNATTAVLNPKAAKVFAVQSRDQFNAVITGATMPAVAWSATGGTIDAAGRYVAGLIPGPAVVTASVATEPATVLTADVRINAAPTVAEPAVATVTTPTTLTLTLHALGADDGGVANLAYTWTVLAGAPGSVGFSGATQNTTAAQTIQATLNVPGTYGFAVRIRDAQGLYTTSTVSISTGQTVPVVAWSTPASITYGTALSAAQLNATSPVPGTFAYTPDLGAILDAGSQTLSVLFTPADGVTYAPVTATVALLVAPAPTTVTWLPLAPITWGTSVGAAQQTATAPVPGTFVYTPAAGTLLEVGNQPLSVLFTPSSPNHASATATNQLLVRQVQPTLTWAAPAALALGSPLTGTQCNATASHAGTIAYVPPIGTVLTEGFHVLRATFTPTDAVHCTQAQASVRIQVIDTTPPTTTYQYDNANRLTHRVYHDGVQDDFTYDAAGRLKTAVSQRYSTSVERDYDAAGRLGEERLAIDGTTYPVHYGYDNANRQTALTYPDGSTVGRGYTARNQLASVTWNGTAVASRHYDAGGRLETTTYGDQVQTETRSYHPGSNMVATIRVPGVTDFSYDYDSIWRKSAEHDLADTSRSQHFGYDDASRLTDWRRGPTAAAPATTRTWDLSLVGDWKHTTVDGVTETREHTPVHEIASVDGQQLEHDVRGNLSRGLPYADGSEARFAWDVENRLASATAADADTGATGTATYRYDALGRRVQKTVWGETTTYIHAGAQVVQRITAPQVLPPAAVADDGDLVAANGTPPGASYLGGGGILAAAQQRVNFQPEQSAIPSGFVADKGRRYDADAPRTNGLVYGWSAVQTGQTERHVYPLPQFDTHVRLQPDGQASPGSWSIALPNGTYAVVVVMGDPISRNQTNDIRVNGTVFIDSTPATTEVEYRAGNFDGYIENITVSDGNLRIEAQATAFDPKLCFVEIGAEGVLATQAERDRLAAVIEAANNQTAKNKPTSLDVASYVYGDYVDEVVAYTQTVGGVTKRYYPHYNHLYSVAALTDGTTGAVVERFTYDAYGKQKITDASGNVTRAKSSVGWDRGFTGYISDNETGLLHARARQYSPTLGRFVGRDPLDYIDGCNLYAAYFIPSNLDPSGSTYTENISEDSWRNIKRNYTVIAYTGDANRVGIALAKVPLDPDWEIAETSDRKCAWVVKARDIVVNVKTVLPNDITSVFVTANGMNAIKEHEGRRRLIYQKGYQTLLVDNLLTGSNTTRCGVVRRNVAGKAKEELRDYLLNLQNKAVREYDAWVKGEQPKIGRGEQQMTPGYTGDVWNPRVNGLLDSWAQRYLVPDPPAFTPPACP